MSIQPASVQLHNREVVTGQNQSNNISLAAKTPVNLLGGRVVVPVTADSSALAQTTSSVAVKVLGSLTPVPLSSVQDPTFGLGREIAQALDAGGNLSNKRINDILLRKIVAAINLNPKWRDLEELDLSKNSITIAGVRELAKLGSLKRLNLSRNVHMGKPAAIISLSALSLAHLNLSDCMLSPMAAVELSRFKKLTSLVIGGNNIGDAGCAAISKIKTLTYLDLSLCGITQAEGLADLPLTYLNLSDNQINMTDKLYQSLIKNTSLQILDLSGIKLTSSFVSLLVKNKALTGLGLKGCGLDDSCTVALSQNRTLCSLSLSRNSITSEGAEILAESSSLQNLDLSHNSIGSFGKKALQRNKNITLLNSDDNANKEEEAMLNEVVLVYGLPSITLPDGAVIKGASGEFASFRMYKYISQFLDAQMSGISMAEKEDLAEAFLYSFNASPQFLYQRLTVGKPVVILRGWQGHAIAYVLQKRNDGSVKMAICNRGEGFVSPHGIVFYTAADASKIDETFIRELQTLYADQNEQKTFIQKKISAGVIGLQASEGVVTSDQTGNNCTLSSLKLALRATLILHDQEKTSSNRIGLEQCTKACKELSAQMRLMGLTKIIDTRNSSELAFRKEVLTLIYEKEKKKRMAQKTPYLTALHTTRFEQLEGIVHSLTETAAHSSSVAQAQTTPASSVPSTPNPTSTQGTVIT